MSGMAGAGLQATAANLWNLPAPQTSGTFYSKPTTNPTAPQQASGTLLWRLWGTFVWASRNSLRNSSLQLPRIRHATTIAFRL